MLLSICVHCFYFNFKRIFMFKNIMSMLKCMVLVSVAMFFVGSATAQNKTMFEHMQFLSNNKNKNLPVRIDQHTKMLSTSVVQQGSGVIFVFNMQVNGVITTLPLSEAKKVIQHLKVISQNEYCTSPNFKYFKDYKVANRTVYTTDQGTYIDEFTVSHLHC